MVIFTVGPGGEFFINDDWSFARAYERFVTNGAMTSTGWGPSYAPGGPALIVHVLWARIFTFIAGESITVLRASILTMGVLGSVGMLILLRTAGAAPLSSLIGALAVTVNPLYVSQSFTFMSDVTFATLSVYAFLFLSLAVRTRKTWLLITGLGVCLGAILVRQIGAVIVVAFLWMCLVHPRARVLGFVRCLLISLGVVFIPWFGYEYGLFVRGGTSLLDHQVIHDVVRNVTTRSGSDYATVLAYNLLGALMYCGIFTSPVWILRFGQFLRKRGFVVFLCIALTAFVIVEVGILTRWIELPVFFWGNVIIDFGIGPIMLKDTAICNIGRLGHLAPWAYYAWALVATLGVGIMVGRTRIALVSLFKDQTAASSMNFLGGLAFWTALLYLGFICASGFHDRYLIPLFIWLIVWLAAEDPQRETTKKAHGAAMAAAAMAAIIGALTVAGTRDFMEMKRALKTAQDYAVNELRLDPCSFDGGFEFNGYYCYDNKFRPSAGNSWWWVHEESAVLALGPLPGYRVEHVFPFHRLLGPNGAVHVLIPESGG